MARKGMVKSIFLLILVAAGITGIIVYKKIALRNSLAARIAALSPRGAPPQSIEDLRAAIDLYGKKIEEHIQDAGRTGIYWKILASRLMEGKKPMYGDALDALEHAVQYYPEDESIHYLIGVSAGNMAKAEYFSPEDQAEHYRVSEAGYLRAIDLHPRYGRALYGLAVLYVYELNRPEEARPLLERFMEINPNDTSGMFVFAAANYMVEDYAAAVDWYDRIIRTTKEKDEKNQAEQLRQQVMDEWYR